MFSMLILDCASSILFKSANDLYERYANNVFFGIPTDVVRRQKPRKKSQSFRCNFSECSFKINTFSTFHFV